MTSARSSPGSGGRDATRVASVGTTSRLVLMPQGTPSHAGGEAACIDVIIRCGGDLQRLIDGPARSVDAFATHVSRMKALDGRIEPLVILHRTNPVALAIIATRRELEKRVPYLRQAGWIIVHDPQVDPFFEHEARELGGFDDVCTDAQIWSSPGGLHYLVARPGSGTPLQGRILELLDRTNAPPISHTERTGDEAPPVRAFRNGA